LSKLIAQKLSQNHTENVKLLKQLKWTMIESQQLQVLNLLCIRIRPEGWECIGEGVEHSSCLKRLIINNCNIRDRNHLALLCKGVEMTNTVDFLDL